MIHRLKHAVRYSDPILAGRHPFQTYMLLLCIFAGIPLLFGQPASQSLEELLPAWMVVLWGASLSLGAGVSMMGAYWRGRAINALTMERVGLLGVGSAAMVYGLILVVYFHGSGITAACLILGFGLASLVRARDIGRVVRIAAHTPITAKVSSGGTHYQYDIVEDTIEEIKRLVEQDIEDERKTDEGE